MALSPCITEESDDFRVVFIARDNDVMPFFGISIDDDLDPEHPGAGGVDHRKPGILQSCLVFRRNTVGPDQDDSGSLFRNFFDPEDFFFLQHLHNLGIMNKRPIGENRLLIPDGCIQNHIHSPTDAHTESGCFCNDDLHQTLLKRSMICWNSAFDLKLISTLPFSPLFWILTLDLIRSESSLEV